jgi:hypothetical protein
LLLFVNKSRFNILKDNVNNMKKIKSHTCKGLRNALKIIESVKSAGPYAIPIIQDDWLGGAIIGGNLDNDTVDAENVLGGTLHMQYIKIKFCPFCGFEYKEETK